MVQSQAVSRSRWLPGLALGLMLPGCLLANSGTVQAQAVAKDEQPGFLIPQEMQAAHLAALAVGGGGQPSVGPFNTIAVLHTGEREQLWTIAPPLLDKKIRTQVGASLLFLSGFVGAGQVCPQVIPQPTLDGLIWLKLGHSWFDSWTLINTYEIQKIPRQWLLQVTDETPIADPEKGNDLELDAYFQMLISAGQTDSRAFYAQAHRDLTNRHLLNQPRKYRGDVVYLQGRLRRLERHEAPLLLREAGFPTLYEAWFFINNNGATPVCALFTELDPKLAVGEKLNAEVGFAGYFYKKYKYGSGITGKQTRYAPLLLGRNLTVLSLPTDGATDQDPNQGLLPLFVSLVAATFLAVVLMTLYFRANDLKVHQHLALVNRHEFALPPLEEPGKFSFEQVTNAAPETTDTQKGSDLAALPFPSSPPYGERPFTN